MKKTKTKKKESPKNSPKTTPKAPEAPKVDLNPWSKKEQKALEKALKKYPVSMDKKERWSAIAKDVNGSDKESKTKSTRKCQSRMKELKAIHQRTAGLGALNQKDADWKLKQNAEKKKAKGYFTTTQDPDERKKQKNKKQDEKKK